MTRQFSALAVTLALLSSCSAKGPDPAVVDPRHHKVEFENDRVRVIHVTIGPHEKTPLHYHPEHVVIALTNNHVMETHKDGKVEEGTGSPSSNVLPAMIHGLENLNDTPLESYIVEFKRR